MVLTMFDPLSRRIKCTWSVEMNQDSKCLFDLLSYVRYGVRTINSGCIQHDTCMLECVGNPVSN